MTAPSEYAEPKTTNTFVATAAGNVGILGAFAI